MKFRFRPSNAHRRLKSPGEKRKILKLRGTDTLRVFKSKALVRNYSAEDFGRFETGKKSRSSARLYLQLRTLSQKISRILLRRFKREPRIPLTTLLGILLSTLTITVASGAFVIFSLFFTYGGAHTDIVIPNFISLSADEATALSNNIFEYEIVYKSNPDFESNSVISQSPLPNVTRKLYKKDGKLKITLTVNQENQYIVLPKLVGTSLRDTLIDLKAFGLKVNIIKEYSQSIPSGIIFASSHQEGSAMKSGDNVTLYVSLGKQTLNVSVPDLTGKSEQEAIALLEKKGFRLGEVRYENSFSKSGTVISQGTAAGISLPQGSKISFTVSAGLYNSLN